MISVSLFVPFVKYGFFTDTVLSPKAQTRSPTAYCMPDPPSNTRSPLVSMILLYVSKTSYLRE
jgi:hypothetical protein